MVAVFGMGWPFVRLGGSRSGTAPTGRRGLEPLIAGEDGHWHVELLHIKSGSELIICLTIVPAHRDETAR